MSDAPVLISSTQTPAGVVRTLTLNRPAALNSFTAAMHAQLLPALDAAATEAAVRAVVITGAGGQFCSGGDISGMVPAHVLAALKAKFGH